MFFQRFRAASRAISCLRFGLRALALALPPFKPPLRANSEAAEIGVGAGSDASPVDRSTINLPSWLGSRGRLGCFAIGTNMHTPKRQSNPPVNRIIFKLRHYRRLTGVNAYVYSPITCSMRGASRGVLEVGEGSGARGQASQACTREALGRRPAPLRGGSALMAGRGTDEGGRKPAGSGRAKSRPGPRPEATAPGTEIAAMERRVASALIAKRAPAKQAGGANCVHLFARRTDDGAPLGAPFPSLGGGGEGRRLRPTRGRSRIRVMMLAHFTRSSPRKRGPSSGCPLSRA